MSDIFVQVQETLQAIALEHPTNAAELETFRIHYLGSKGRVKALMEEMRLVPNERKREFGQLVNAIKQQGE